MQYVLTAKELTELAKEVATLVNPSRARGERDALIKSALQARGIVWYDDE